MSERAESLLAFSDGSKVRIAARSRGRVMDVNGRGARFALEEGKVSVDVVHRPRAQWTFEAGPFLVSVHGTSFTVAWNPSDAVFELRLQTGAVSVASPLAGTEIGLRAGQTLRVSLRDLTSTVATAVDGAGQGDGQATANAVSLGGQADSRSVAGVRGATDHACRAARAGALVPPRLDDRARREQGARHRCGRGSPWSRSGARASRQRRSLGAGERRPICGPLSARPPGVDGAPTSLSVIGSGRGRGFPAGALARRRSRRSGECARLVRSVPRRSARRRARLGRSREENDALAAIEPARRSARRRARLLAEISARHVCECGACPRARGARSVAGH